MIPAVQNVCLIHVTEPLGMVVTRYPVSCSNLVAMSSLVATVFFWGLQVSQRKHVFYAFASSNQVMFVCRMVHVIAPLMTTDNCSVIAPCQAVYQYCCNFHSDDADLQRMGLPLLLVCLPLPIDSPSGQPTNMVDHMDQPLCSAFLVSKVAMSVKTVCVVRHMSTWCLSKFEIVEMFPSL